MNKMKSSRLWRKKRRKGHTDQIAAQLAPLEEQDRPAAEHQIGSVVNAATRQADPRFGAIIVDNEDLKVPTDIIDTNEDQHFLGIEPVVLVVLILMLVFIGFVAWQISLMPPQ